jgi:hypothetical protein
MKYILGSLFGAVSAFIVVYTVVKNKELSAETIAGFFFMAFVMAAGALLAGIP